MKQTTYSIIDEEVLLSEKTYDDHKNLIQSIDYSLRPKEEKKFYYNDKNLLIREESMIDDRVGDTQEFDYDDDGKLLEQRHNIGGSLYEKTLVEKTDSVETRKVLQDDEETQRIEIEAEGETKVYKFYDYGNLAQVNRVTKDGNTMTTHTEVIGADQQYIEVQTFNDAGDMIESAEYVGEGNCVATFKQEYDGKNRTKVIFENLEQPHLNYEESFTYDENGNRIAFEKSDASGRLIQFEKVRYNDNNQVIERAGNNGSSKFHHRIDYD